MSETELKKLEYEEMRDNKQEELNKLLDGENLITPPMKRQINTYINKIDGDKPNLPNYSMIVNGTKVSILDIFKYNFEKETEMSQDVKDKIKVLKNQISAYNILIDTIIGE